jgi:hypothetical protein
VAGAVARRSKLANGRSIVIADGPAALTARPNPVGGFHSPAYFNNLYRQSAL